MSRELLSRAAKNYLRDFVPSRPAEMEAMEAYAEETAFPIIGPAAGHFCYLVARMLSVRRAFEMGSGYGYSTAWLATAVQENGGGKVYHTDWDQKLSDRAKRHMARLGLDQIVEYRVGEAIQLLRATSGPFDLIFNDIHKEGYPESLSVIKEKLRPRGVLIVYNVLWSGRVFDAGNQAPSTRNIREFTERITSDAAWIVSIVPIRDGLLLAYKK
jgi:caffeoyl-CoA O-methyltransferase